MQPSPSAYSPLSFRPLTPEDADAVLAIYQEGIETGNATFADKAPDWSEWNASRLPECRIAAVEEGHLIGWASLSGVSDRCVYGGVAEVSVYVAAASMGRGVGSELLKALIKESEANNIWMLQAGIFPENEASITLHQNLGFRILGVRERLGKMSYGPLAGKWRDVVLLERRSNVAGAD